MSTFDMTQGAAVGSLGKEMTGGQMADAIISGTPVMVRIIQDPSVKLTFPQWGDSAYRLLLNVSCSVSLAEGIKNQLQRMTLVLQQPYAGNSEVVFSDKINWQGKQPFIDTRAGAITIIEILSDGSGAFYGRLIYG